MRQTTRTQLRAESREGAHGSSFLTVTPQGLISDPGTGSESMPVSFDETHWETWIKRGSVCVCVWENIKREEPGDLITNHRRKIKNNPAGSEFISWKKKNKHRKTDIQVTIKLVSYWRQGVGTPSSTEVPAKARWFWWHCMR